ncbi:MAG: (2Fe-2S) ferredoxin domain-containing protein [Pleomorphochaeta sp.]
MKKVVVELCMGSSCFSRGNSRTLELLESFIKENHYQDRICIKGHLCLGRCSSGPIVKINNKDFENINPACVIDIIQEELKKDDK